MRKTLTYSSFVVASFVVVATFIVSRTYTHLGVAIFIYAILIYVAYELFVRRNPRQPVVTVQAPIKSAKKVEVIETAETKKEGSGSTDIDKRDFLKMIGAAGISIFLFSILSRRPESMFFGKVANSGVVALEDSSGTKINPAESQPTDGYRISEIDDNDFTYYGFTNKTGGWFIMKEDPDTGSFRYSKGESDFSSNWKGRKRLGYDYYHKVFS